jgi:hypothetical protein
MFNNAKLKPNQLLFDPNNYRFQGEADYTHVQENRYHEATVQDRVYKRILSDPTLIDLKNSIIKNGFVPVDRIVVTKYQHKDDLYLIVEGNRRSACIKWIIEDDDTGIEFRDDLLESLKNIDVVVVQPDDEASIAALMGIRHVSGAKQWGGYQSAKLIVDMRDGLSLDAADIADRLGMKAREVNRRYRAFKALEQMEEDEEFGEYCDGSLYPLFHEAVSLPVVRTWLEWNESSNEFDDIATRDLFYQLLSPRVSDSGQSRRPKITTYSQIRELKLILSNDAALQSLEDLDAPFTEALVIAEREQLSRTWQKQIAEATKALESLKIEEVISFTDAQIKPLQELEDLIKRRLVQHTTLTSQQVSQPVAR